MIFSKECVTEKKILSYGVGFQNNRLNETILLSTQKISFRLWLRIFYNFKLKFFVYLNLWRTKNILNSLHAGYFFMLWLSSVHFFQN